MQSNEEKNCAQVVLGSFSESLGLDKEKAEALAAPFGGGRYAGETCGCVTAATMVVGLAYDGAELFEKVKAFDEAFAEENGHIVCKDILGHDFSQPGELEAAYADGSVESHCPRCIESSISILKKLLEKE